MEAQCIFHAERLQITVSHVIEQNVSTQSAEKGVKWTPCVHFVASLVYGMYAILYPRLCVGEDTAGEFNKSADCCWLSDG